MEKQLALSIEQMKHLKELGCDTSSAILSLVNLEQSTSVDYETYLNIQKEKDKLRQKWREPKT